MSLYNINDYATHTLTERLDAARSNRNRCVVYIIFALVPQLDNFATAAALVFDAMLPMFMFLVLFVTFCKVDFRKLRPVAWHWWVGVFQLLCVGAVMATVLAFGLSGNLLILAEALLTCIISPCASAARS